jgi:hypothetical protein
MRSVTSMAYSRRWSRRQVRFMELIGVVSPLSMANNANHVLLNWNVGGLNNPARKHVVRELIRDHKCQTVCLQESKLQHIDDAMIIATMG